MSKNQHLKYHFHSNTEKISSTNLLEAVMEQTAQFLEHVLALIYLMAEYYSPVWIYRIHKKYNRHADKQYSEADLKDHFNPRLAVKHTLASA